MVLGGAAATWPLAARAQQRRVATVGYLDGSGLPNWLQAFRRGLADLGYVEGQTVIIEQRSAGGQVARLRGLADELVRLKSDVIVASGSPAAVGAKDATATTPIVFTFATDPVGAGLVATLARPGGNITGQSNQAPGLVGKRLQLLSEMLPGVSQFGVIWTPSFAANHFDFQEMRSAAATLHVGLDSFELKQPDELNVVFKQAAVRCRGVAVLSGPLIFTHRENVVAAAARHQLPAIYYDAEYAEAGGLMSYGPSLVDLHRSAALYVDKILKGAKPADLPVEQPTRFKLVVNMKAASALGVSVPSALFARADQVID